MLATTETAPVQCPHCGGEHPAYAHEDLGVAVTLCDGAIVDGRTSEARRWLRVVAKLARRAA